MEAKVPEESYLPTNNSKKNNKKNYKTIPLEKFPNKTSLKTSKIPAESEVKTVLNTTYPPKTFLTLPKKEII